MNMAWFSIILLSLFFIGFFSAENSYGNKVVKEYTEKNKGLPSVEEGFKIQVIQGGLNFPTKMAFIDNDLFIAQKTDGKVLLIRNFELEENPVLDVNVEGQWEKGLVGLVSARTESKDFLFIYYTESAINQDTITPPDQGGRNNGTKLYRYLWDGKSLSEPTLILNPLPVSNIMHHGGAMAIRDDHLYLITGNNREGSFLQNQPEYGNNFDTSVIFGIDFNGNPSPTNPFIENSKLAKYFAYGIRNGYGLAVDPITNYLWDTENGASNFDEINLIFPGFNSGYIKIQGPKSEGYPPSMNASDLTFLDGSQYSDPEFSWRETPGITAIEFFNSNKFGVEYKNDVFVGDTYGQLYRLKLNETRTGFTFEDKSLQDLIADSPQEVEKILFGRNLGLITDIKTGIVTMLSK